MSEETQKIMRELWDDVNTIELNGEKYFHDYQVMEAVEKILKCQKSTLSEERGGITKEYMDYLRRFIKFNSENELHLIDASKHLVEMKDFINKYHKEAKYEVSKDGKMLYDKEGGMYPNEALLASEEGKDGKI